jgi:hypothetical protein
VTSHPERLWPRSIEMFEQVVAAAPDFARAWADYAMTLATALRRGDQFPAQGVTRAKVIDAAQTALALDARLGIANQALALLMPWGRVAERAALNRQALAQSPNDPEVLMGVGVLAAEVGRLGDALECARQALELDPLYAVAGTWYAAMINAAGRYDEARALWDQSIARWPDSRGTLAIAFRLAGWHREWERADALSDAIRRRGFSDEATERDVAFFEGMRSSDRTYRKRFLASVRATLAETGLLSLRSLRDLHLLGLTEDVFHLVDDASFADMFDEDGPAPGIGSTSAILFHDLNMPMIRDPRFVGLCAKLGLCDYWESTGRWPDCADQVDYDFRAEARRLLQIGPDSSKPPISA